LRVQLGRRYFVEPELIFLLDQDLFGVWKLFDPLSAWHDSSPVTSAAAATHLKTEISKV
jgi:hypothetical protein